MKVMLVIPYNPLEEVGGLELGTLRLAKDMRRCGVETIIVTKGTTGNFEGISIIGFPSLPEIGRYLINNLDIFDIVHWLEIFPDSGEVDIQAMISRLLRSFGKKVIFMVATSGNLENRGTGELTTPLIKSCADAYVISNTDQVLEFAKAGIDSNLVNIIGFGVDASNVFKPVDELEKAKLRVALGLPKDKILCLFVGRFVERKRPDFLLKAWSSLDDLYDKTELVIVGSGMQQHDSIESSVVGLAKDAKHVFFRDITDCPHEYYQACDILLLPSSREGQPNVLLEAMACGNAVIGSDIAGINELLLDKINGITFDPNNHGNFTEAIRLLVNNKDLCLKYGNVARQDIMAKKDLSIVTEQYLNLYNKKERK